ncbi:MAG: glycosyltransferase family 9 protein [Minisyncoccia bacterium]
MSPKLKFYIFIRKIWFVFGQIVSVFMGGKKDDSKKILIVRTDNIGDFILFTPALKYIKRIFPEYQIHFLGNKSIFPLVKFSPEIDLFIPLDIKKFQFNFFYFVKNFLKFRKENYEKIIVPVYSRSITLDELVKILNGYEKIGFDGDCNNIPEEIKFKNNNIYTKLLKLNIPLDKFEGYRYKEFLKFLGYNTEISIESLIPKINIPEYTFEKSLNLLKSFGWYGNKYVVVHPGAGMLYRIWPIENFIEIIRWLKNRGYEVVVSGSKDERWIVEKIKADLPFIIDIVGKVYLDDLLGILKKADFYFGAETSVLHLSAALGTPTICLLGGGHFGRFFPYGDLKKNRIVYDKKMQCKNDNWKCAKKNLQQPAPCIKNIPIKEVKKEIEFLIRNLEV